MVYDIFISYRREGGGATAGRIYDSLIRDGYTVSYDVNTLREGRFDKQLLERIEQCQDFILVVDKNCFERTIDPSTNPEEDWLWQELSYALSLKKNIIPVLQAGAKFPKKLPEDIDNVRFSNGPVYSHVYYDEFYKKLRDDFLRAYPRLAKIQYDSPVSPTNALPNLKLKADTDCVFYLDGEERVHLKVGVIKKIPLAQGEYELTFVSEDNDNDRLEMEFEMPNVDKLQKVNLNEVRTVRLQKEAEAKRIAEEKRRVEEERKRREEEEQAKERMFTVGDVSFKMVRVEGDDMGLFYIGETQVTQALWQTVMGNNPSTFKGQDHPVECVSWNDICGLDGTGNDPNCFLFKLNQKTGKNFRLPKELEWEYAAKCGNKSKNYVYAGGDDIDMVAWYTGNSKNMTQPVKQLSPNELGIYDMSGNVWEWCEDLYNTYGSFRVLRGGSWNDLARFCVVSYRSIGNSDKRRNRIGFRLVLSQ